MRIERIEPVRLRSIRRRGDVAQWPSGFDPSIVLNHTLNECEDIEGMRAEVKSKLDTLDKGMCLVAVARCCDSGYELAERLTASGCVFAVTNLMNNEISMLRPEYVVLFESVRIFNGDEDADRSVSQVVDFTKEVFPGCKIGSPFECSLPKRFVTKVLDAGMLWTKK